MATRRQVTKNGSFLKQKICKNCKHSITRIDKCMRVFTSALYCSESVKATCCGHGVYPMTIVVEDDFGKMFDLISGVNIPRKRKFYKRDKNGMYYIPEVVNRK